MFNAQGGKKSLSVAKEPAKLTSILHFFTLYSAHHKGKTVARNDRSQPNSFLEK